MPTFLRPIIARLIASVVGAFASYLLVHYGVTLDADTQLGLEAVMLGFFGVIYSVIHRAINARINPGDAATQHMAVKERSEERAGT